MVSVTTLLALTVATVFGFVAYLHGVVRLMRVQYLLEAIATESRRAIEESFPPASAYRLNRCLFALKSDDAFRARFLQDARAAMSELELDAEDSAALLRVDRDALLARGAHPYLVFMADLRLRMEREPVSFEFF